MFNLKNKSVVIFLAFSIMMLLGLVLSNNAYAATATSMTIVDTIGGSEISFNPNSTNKKEGNGWVWTASDSTLTISGFNGEKIEANGDFTLKLVGNDNYIRVSGNNAKGLYTDYDNGTITIVNSGYMGDLDRLGIVGTNVSGDNLFKANRVIHNSGVVIINVNQTEDGLDRVCGFVCKDSYNLYEKAKIKAIMNSSSATSKLQGTGPIHCYGNSSSTIEVTINGVSNSIGMGGLYIEDDSAAKVTVDVQDSNPTDGATYALYNLNKISATGTLTVKHGRVTTGWDYHSFPDISSKIKIAPKTSSKNYILFPILIGDFRAPTYIDANTNEPIEDGLNFTPQSSEVALSAVTTTILDLKANRVDETVVTAYQDLFTFYISGILHGLNPKVSSDQATYQIISGSFPQGVILSGTYGYVDGTYEEECEAGSVTIRVKRKSDNSTANVTINYGAISESTRRIKTWAQLQTALNNGGTVYLIQDITAGAGDTTLSATNTSTLDLNGYTINANGLFSPVIMAYGNLTITDSTSNREHSPAITYNNPVKNETITVKGGVITGGNGTSAAVNATYGSEVNMYGGTICGNTNNMYDGGGVRLNGSTFNLHGGAIVNNTSIYGSGGGVFVYEAATFNMNGGKVSHNTCANTGGGFFLYNNQGNSSRLNLNGGTISENKSQNLGGGVCVNSNGGRLSVSGNPVVTGNKAGDVVNNLYAHTDIFVGVSAPLTSGANIGISTPSVPSSDYSPTFTSGYNTYNNGDNPNLYFKSDYDGVVAGLNSSGEAMFELEYTVTVSSDEHGTATANIAKGVKGTEVTLTATPNDSLDYRFKEWQVISGGVTINNNKFTIGSSNVEVKAIFEETPITSWARLQSALNKGGTVTLTQDITAEPTSTTLNISRSTVLDLNGHIIDAKGYLAPVIYLSEYSNFRIDDSNPTAIHTPQFTYKNPITNEDVVVNGGIITGGKDGNLGSGIEANRSALTINAGSIVGNTTTQGDGAGIYLRLGATCTMNGGLIAGNHTTGNGGGVYLGAYSNYTNTFYMKGGSIKHNSADGKGGGVYLWSDQTENNETFDISGGRIEENKSIGNGGGICIDPKGDINLSKNPVIIGNKKGDLNNNIYGQVNVIGKLTEGALIGITEDYTDSAFTNGFSRYNSGDNPADYFVSDLEGKVVVLTNDNEATLSQLYNITVISDSNGTATANVTEGIQGTEVTLTATPNNSLDYKFKKWQVISGGVTIKNNKFTIGTSNVKVKAIFEETPIATWARLQSALNKGGTVTLTQDITAGPEDNQLYVNKEVTLDLNGHIINRNLNAPIDNGGVIFVDEPGNLTINDSNPTATHTPAITYTDLTTNEEVTVNGGIITGGYTNSGSGAIYYKWAYGTINGGTIVGNKALGTDISGNSAGLVVRSSTVTMNGGAIVGNEAIYGDGDVCTGGVHISDLQGSVTVFNMNGGIIASNYTNSTDNSCMGGVHAYAGFLNVSGNVKIYGNMKDGKENNVILSNTTKGRAIHLIGALTEGAHIGVIPWRIPPYWYSPEDFTTDYNTYNSGVNPSTYFSLDDDNAMIVYDGTSEAKVALKYTITVTNDGKGTATVSKSEITWFEHPILTVAPNSGYRFKEWQVVSGDVIVNAQNEIHLQNAQDAENPITNVNIKAVFEKIPNPKIIGNSIIRKVDGTATIRFKSDEAGTYYYVVKDSSQAPTAKSVRTATSGIHGSGTANIGLNTIDITGLSEGQKYAYIIVNNGKDGNVLSISMPYDVYFYDDFDSYDVNTTINQISGYSVQYDGTGNVNQKIISSERPDNTVGNVLQLQGAGNWAADVRHSFVPDDKQYVVFETIAKPVSGSSPGCDNLGSSSASGGWTNAVCRVSFDKENKFNYGKNDSSSFCDTDLRYTMGDWYNLKMILDNTNNIYYISVNDTFINRFAYEADPATPEWFSLGAGNIGTNTMYYDSVKVYTTDTITLPEKPTIKLVIKDDTSTTSTSIAGAHVQLIDKNGNVLEEYDSTTEPYTLTNDVFIDPSQKDKQPFTIKVTTVPKKYNKPQDSTFTVNTSNYEITYSVNKFTDNGELIIPLEVKQYTVSFETYGGGTIANQTVKYGSKATKPTTDPSRGKDYTFTGWYKEPEMVTEFDFTKTITSNTTIYAGYTKNKWTDTSTDESAVIIKGNVKVTDTYTEEVTNTAIYEERVNVTYSNSMTEEVLGKITAAKTAVETYLNDHLYTNNGFVDSSTELEKEDKRKFDTLEPVYNSTEHAKIIEHVTSGSYKKVTECTSTATVDYNSKYIFPDVVRGKWYSDGIEYCKFKGLMSGYSSGANVGKFGLDDPIKRAQIAVVLYRLAGSPYGETDKNTTLVSPFSDVQDKGKYYYKAVIWANEKGVVTGYTSGANKGKFGPDDYIKRQDMAVMLGRYAKFIMGKDTTSTFSLSKFRDNKDVSNYAKENTYIQYIVENEIITGKEKKDTNGKTYFMLDPKATAKRSEAAKMLMSFCKNILGM